MIQKSYDKKSEKGTLYIIPTPIGNLKDITLRSLETLEEVDVIYAEDTRTSSTLLNNYNIKKSLKSCHIHNESTVKFKILEELNMGKNIALISDQGTPLLSDPGYEVVSEIINSGINVVALPGASALLPALNTSGIEANHFLFYGFLNSKQTACEKELKKLKNLEFTLVFYESPHRLNKTLNSMLTILGDRNISISREISKMHEEIFRGRISEAIEFYKNVKGELVIIVEKVVKDNSIDISALLKEIKKEISNGLSNKDAVKAISKKYGVSKNLLYNKNEEKRK